MSDGTNVRIGLSQYLDALLLELSKARRQSEKENLDYALDVVTLELDVSCTFTQSVEWKTKVVPEFWVLPDAAKAAADGLPQSYVQRLTLRLVPRLEDFEPVQSAQVVTISSLVDQHSVNKR